MRIDYESLVDVIDDIIIYIPKLINACESVSELFYRNVTKDTWDVFQNVLTGYEDLYKVLQMTLIDSKEHEMEWNGVLEDLLNKIPNHFIMLSEELKTSNNVAVGDLIRYEWTPLLMDILKLFKENR